MFIWNLATYRSGDNNRSIIIAISRSTASLKEELTLFGKGRGRTEGTATIWELEPQFPLEQLVWNY